MTAVALPFDESLLARTEDAGLNASATNLQRVFDGWLLRLSPGKAKRARCITALAPGRLPLADKLARCRAIYAAAGLPLIVRITPFSQPPGLDDELERMGLGRFDESRVLVLDALAAQPEPAKPPRGLSLERVGSEAFARVVGQLRGSPLSHQQAQAERLAQSPVPFDAWVVRRDGQVVACGQIAVESELVGLYDIYTHESARGQGLATLLCRLLLQRGRVLGARVAYLQVDADNRPALAVYERLGFRDAYGYHYRAAPPGSKDAPGSPGSPDQA